MKTKPVVITLLIVAALICGFFFARSKYLVKPERAEIVAFLNEFNSNVTLGNVKSAGRYFDDSIDKGLVTTLVNILSNKTGMNSKGKPMFAVTLNTDDCEITIVNPDLYTATVTARFHRDSIDLNDQLSTIAFTIHRNGPNDLKIYRVDATSFTKDYKAFQNAVINKTIPETDIFSPQTLAAFKIAKGLKARYDSVLWFQHVEGKPWFYVVSGDVPEDLYYEEVADNPTKYSKFHMGLLNPNLKEIIPPLYQLIHNIGGTLPGMIEVEKDHKKGLYNTDGKLVVPVEYEQLYPLNATDEYLALLKNGEDYFYLQKDLSISNKVEDFKIDEALPRIKDLNNSFKLSDKSTKNIMELNSRTDLNSLVVSPSYMVELGLLPKFINLPNPLRKVREDFEGGGSGYVEQKYSGTETKEDNWFVSAFYSVFNDYLDGRTGLYQTKNVLIVDKKQNRILGFDESSYMGGYEGGGVLSGDCNENRITAINDSLFEFKTTSSFYQPLFTENEQIEEGPYYHYLQVKNGKLVALKGSRIFPTQFTKLDDSYLQGCYIIEAGTYKNPKRRTVDHLTTEMLKVMKNEIYASYNYKFKEKRWQEVFIDRFNDDGEDAKRNISVDDSLTAIDKYNINWINSKLNPQKPAVLAAQ
jgi:hypothetical protein